MRVHAVLAPVFVLASVTVVPSLATAQVAAASTAKIAPWLGENLDRGGVQEFLVLLEDPHAGVATQPAAGADLYARLGAAARTAQAPLLQELRARGVRVRPYWLVNALLVEGDRRLADMLAARPEVVRLVGNPQVRGVEALGTVLTPRAPDTAEWGVAIINAPQVWSTYNDHGEGIVVASMDTGVDWTHPALKSKYRGYDGASGNVDHRYSWHDAIGDSAAPFDDNNHGTHTTGTMVGDDGAGNQVGVAPGAKWVACRNMDHGTGTPARYIECMEWTLAPYPPGGNSLTDGRPDLAPHIASNSWVCPPDEGCDPGSLELAFSRLRQAGVFEVSGAGNDGPSCGTLKYPGAIYEETCTVGAMDSDRNMSGYSSRGPVTVDGSNRMKPDLTGPGTGVRSTVPGGGYATMTGTSMATPHVSGAAALLWSARPNLRGAVDLSRCILRAAASGNILFTQIQSCGGIPTGTLPNNVAGAGLVDALAALQLPNSDGDAAPDACDCAPTNAGAFALPPEAQHLRFPAKTTLAWDPLAALSGTGVRYDLLRGDVATLRHDGNIGGATCVARNTATPGASDTSVPAAGAASYWLVRGRNTCGLGTWGTMSSGTPRSYTGCN